MDEKPLLIETGKGLSLKYKNKFLYSKFDPTKQPRLIIESLELDDKCIYLMPSPLLFYGYDLLKNKLPESSIIVNIEVDPNLLNLTNRPEEIHPISNGFDFLNIISKIDLSKFKRCKLVTLNGGYTLYKTAYDRFFNILINQQHNYWKNRYTLTQMGQLWIKNCLKNLKDIEKAQPFSNLKTDKPVVVIGAGESTEQTLSLLKDIREKIFLLCVDTALQILLEVNITPDAVVALEGQFFNLPDFYGAKDKKIDIIYDLSSYPAVLRNLSGNRYITITNFSNSLLLEKIKKLNPDQDFIPPLGSVGITAIYIAMQITENSIFLSGLDFSYKLGKTHSKGTPYHLSTLIKMNKINSGYNFGSCLKRGTFAKKNKSHNDETTDPILYEYSKHAEELLLGSNRVYDLTTTGMTLGVQHADKAIVYNEINKKKAPLINNYNSNIKQLNYGDLYRDEVNKILFAFKKLKSYLNGSTSIEKAIESLTDISYLFEHYPETEPIKIITEVSIKRLYFTISRYIRSLGI
ncbi:DUF115 domain-containing protein [Thiospirochaeta perfilievii]|uniref:DUF115 domain-containing protein n=1 Tax=Thiospirochaeta perfilievii TaxID=252967 RepID=A0A5C1Q831_9SPIO|nr:6-hydroxymethylpterin diphosphokinase MptE-like protein [Thiospirochaeta perfilievii]QEN03200.1 DUF115 domain-containing protein [Thiospirochaeta perfilievii]